MPRYKDRTFWVSTTGPTGASVGPHTNKRQSIRAARSSALSGGDGARADVTLKIGGTGTLIYQCRNDHGRVVVEEL